MESQEQTSESRPFMSGEGPFKRLDHIGIAVWNADAAIPYYRDILGLELVADEVAGEAGTRLVYFRVGESFIQLVEPISEDTPVRAWLQEFGEGIHHMCLAVDDLADAISASADPTQVEITAAGRNRRACFLNGVQPETVRIEITETNPSR